MWYRGSVYKRYIKTLFGLPKLASTELGMTKAAVASIFAIILVIVPHFQLPPQITWIQAASPYFALTILITMAIHVLIKKNIELEDRQKSKVEIIFDNQNRPFNETEPLICNGPALKRTFCIGIHNPGNETVSRCIVKLITKEPPGAFLPIALKLHNENPQPTQGTVLYPQHDFQQEFIIRPHDTEYVDIAKFCETNQKAEIELCYATEGKKNGNIVRWIKPDIEHTLFIEVYASVGDVRNLQFKVWVDKTTHKFHCEQII